MKIVNKEQMAEMPNGTVFRLYTPNMLYDELYVISGHYEDDDGTPFMNGVIPVCPFFGYEQEGYVGRPSDTSYYTDCWSTDVSLADYDNDQLFAVFSKAEVVRMIHVLSYGLSGCEGPCVTDEDFYIIP